MNRWFLSIALLAAIPFSQATIQIRAFSDVSALGLHEYKCTGEVDPPNAKLQSMISFVFAHSDGEAIQIFLNRNYAFFGKEIESKGLFAVSGSEIQSADLYLARAPTMSLGVVTTKFKEISCEQLAEN